MEQRILPFLAPAIIESNFLQTELLVEGVQYFSTHLFCRVFPTLLPSYCGFPIIRLALLYDQRVVNEAKDVRIGLQMAG